MKLWMEQDQVIWTTEVKGRRKKVKGKVKENREFPSSAAGLS